MSAVKMPFIEHAIWVEGTPFAENPIPTPLPNPADFEVAILGGGFTGLHAALRLKTLGIKAAIFEKHTCGWGASHRNAGMMLPGYKAPLQKLLATYGLAQLKELWAWSYRAIEFVKEYSQKHSIPIELNENGQLLLAINQDHCKILDEEAEFLHKVLDHNTCFVVEPGKLKDEIDSTRFAGGLVDPLSCGINPYKYVMGLKELALAQGVAIFEGREIKKIGKSGTRFLLSGKDFQATATNVLVAGNGYTDIAPIKRTVFPVGSYMIATEPLEDDLAKSLFPNNRMMFDTRNFLNYFRLTEKNQFMFGGRDRLTAERDPLKTAGALCRDLTTIFPQLKGKKVTHLWGGHLGLNYRLIPACGQLDGIYFATGYCGHGVAAASLLGYEAASWIAGKGKPILADCKPIISRTYALHPLYLPIVTAYYRLKDRLF